MVNTREYEWSDVNVVVAGRVVTGLRGIKYGSKQERNCSTPRGTSLTAYSMATRTSAANSRCYRANMRH